MSSEPALLWNLTDRLRATLPASWRVGYDASALPAPRVAAVLAIQAPDGNAGELAVVVAMTPPTPSKIESIARELASREPVRDGGKGVLVLGPYLSPGAREACVRLGLGYSDETGALRLSLARPAVFIECQGASKNPNPRKQAAASLRGRAAARVVRALASVKLPIDGRSLAERAATSPAQVSKILALLVDEGLIEKAPRGPVSWTDTRRLIERWAEDYSPLSRRPATYLLSPRGIAPVLDALRKTGLKYAISGAVAANSAVHLAASPRLVIYSADTRRLREELPVVLSDRGAANVCLVESPDEHLFAESATREGLCYAPWSQVVVDLLTGTKREPSVGEKLLDWLQDSDDE